MLASSYVRVALVAVAIACAKPPGASSAPTSRNDRNLITQEQLRAQPYQSAYEAVESLRSNWFNTKGSDSFRNPTEVRVYLDNVSLGNVQTLRTIAVNSVSYIRYYDGLAATSRWGLNHGAGVIFVSTRPATEP